MTTRKKAIIIAEAGVNHNGDIERAKEMIEVASQSGADYVKFQTFSADLLARKNAPKARYQVDSANENENQWQMLKNLELSMEDHVLLFEQCKKNRIGFLSTGFDAGSVDFLVSLGQDFIKIPSGEVTNLPYLRHIGKIGKPTILSTGMATLDEVRRAHSVLIDAGLTNENITVLHCTTAYPTELDQVNLRAMVTIQKSLNCSVGYSDHTAGFLAAVAAISNGATMIEKHFTLDQSLPGPDHKASLNPDSLFEYVKYIRDTELLLGSDVKKPTDVELENIFAVRKSIVASKFIAKGDVFSEHNLTTMRPADGISPMSWDLVIGTQAQRDFLEHEKIEI